MPKVSIVIPYWKDSEPYIQDTLASVRNQTFTDFECIVSGDGVLPPVMARHPIKVTFTKRHQGTYFALNHGIKMATGEWIAILAGDDILTKDSLEKRVAAIRKDTALVCGQAVTMKRDGSLDLAYRKAQEPFTELRKFYGPTILIKRSVFDQAGFFNETLKWRQDKEMWMRLFGKEFTKETYGHFIVLQDILGVRRLRRNSLQGTFHDLPREEKVQAYEAFNAVVKEY